MNRIFLLLLLAMIATTDCDAARRNRRAKAVKKPKVECNIDRIDPTDWYVGMKNPKLQLMVYGRGIREAEVNTDYANARIDSIVRLDSPDYLLIYMDLRGAQPGQMALNFNVGGKKKTVNYELKRREMAGTERKGFTNADVLYMLMPDRFAEAPSPLNPPEGGLAANAKAKSKRKVPLQGDLEGCAFSFNRSEPSLRHGGNLEGIRRHLDYFNQLGVTALWFTPVLENLSPDNGNQSTYHGYATTDYYRVDPRFGTNSDYRKLTDEAHQKGLKVVMDMIFNHCGFDHPWVANMPSKDWFNITTATPPQPSPQGEGVSPVTFVDKNGTLGAVMSSNVSHKSPSPRGEGRGGVILTSYKLTPVLDPYASEIDMKETTEGWFVPSMPDLNQRNPHVMRYLIQNSFWWIETVGIDGIRMDTYPYAFREGMVQWMRELLEEYPNYNVVGETWVTEPAYTAAWQKDSRLSTQNSYLPTVMDFSFYDKINQAKAEETDAWWQGYNRIYNSLVYDYLYEKPENVMAFIDNHDTDRFLGDGRDTLALKQALALLLTIKRIPQLYYGTEILMGGTKAVTDGNVRKDFPGGWEGDERDCFTKTGRTKEENQMFNWLSRMLHWRQGNDVIVKGEMKQWCPVDGVYVIQRSYKGRNVMVILNGTKKTATFKAARYREAVPQNASAREVTSGRHYDITKDFRLSPRQTLVLEY